MDLDAKQGLGMVNVLPRPPRSVSWLFNFLDWPSLPSTLDEAQMLALKHGLKKELSIIEGPLRTGKTFLGLCLVKLLLANLKGPILVICMTNHALDQFLEGVQYK